MRNVKVFVCYNSISLKELPEPYAEALHGHHGLEPEILCLPWPEPAIPQVGSIVRCDELPTGLEAVKVDSIEYVICEEEIRVEVNVHVDEEEFKHIPPAEILGYFAKAGFVIFSSWDKPLKEILSEAGLLT